VKEIWTSRTAQAASRYAEHAPLTTACCNACRACFTANVFSLVTAGLAAVGMKFRRPRT
jgi:hypothetical protein